MAVTAGEAELEAGAGQRFGPEQEDDQRADGDEAQGDRLAAEGDAGEDQQGGGRRREWWGPRRR